MQGVSIRYIPPKNRKDGDSAATIVGSELFDNRAKFDGFSYAEKLKFWELIKAAPDYVTYTVSDKKETVSFTINPSNKEEFTLYFKWRIQLIKDRFKGTPYHEEWLKKWDFEKAKQNYFEVTCADANKYVTIEYCKSAIAKLKSELNTRLVPTSVDEGYRHIIEKADFVDISNRTYFDYEGFLRGMNIAMLIPFYEDKISQMEKGKKSKDVTNAELKDRFLKESYFDLFIKILKDHLHVINDELIIINPRAKYVIFKINTLFELMQYQNMSIQTDSRVLALLFNKCFSNLNMGEDGSSLRKKPKDNDGIKGEIHRILLDFIQNAPPK